MNGQPKDYEKVMKDYRYLAEREEWDEDPSVGFWISWWMVMIFVGLIVWWLR